MKGNVSRVVRYGAGLLGLATLGWVLTGQAAKPVLPVLQGLPTDWSHRHLIFSQPATARQVERVTQDPRYWQQWYRQNVARVLAPDVAASTETPSWMNWNQAHSGVHRDWSEDLGTIPVPPLTGGNFPAKYSFITTTANCGSAATPDYVVFSTNLAGSATQATIVAYDNLYSGCASPVPAVFWAYNTGGQVLTSPVVSGDGQVAFVQTASGAATLVLLKWAPGGSVSSPGAITSVGPSSYRACTAPCMTTINLKDNVGNPTDDTTSSPFPDYTDDIIWVGGTGGWLHKITGVFRGSPAEVATGGFPVQMTAGAALSSPVYDYASANVFVGDLGGYFYRVVASSGQVFQSGRIDFGTGLVAGPIVDSTAGWVYVFSSDDGSGTCAGAPCSGVFKFANNFSSGTGSEVTVGTSAAAPNPLYEGAFDATYLASANATGFLYVCGDTGVNPILYRVPITGGTFSAAVDLAALTAAGNHRTCSPVTDISNPNATIIDGLPTTVATQERVFFSVANNAHPTICANGGCALSFVNMPWQAKTSYQVGQEILVYRPANNLLYINVATNALPGTSGTTAPTWPAAIGTTTPDGTVTWLNQGATTVAALANWISGHVYNPRTRIVDSHGNVEIVRTGGTSGGGPTWATTAGLTTLDGTVTWVNAGVLPSAGLPANGGTGGIIMDNVVAQGTMTGASQVYFNTLSNEVCATSGGTGSCAVQASQSALK